MKIYSDYEKKLKDFEAVERNHNRGYKVFFFFSFLGFAFLIYALINLFTKKEYGMNDFMLLAIGIAAFALFLIGGFIRFYILKILPKKRPLFTDILNTYKKGNIIKELGEYGIDKANLDTIIVPNGYISIAYICDKNCYIEANVERGGFYFETQVSKNVLSNVEVKIFDKHLKHQYGKAHKFSSKNYNKDLFYKEFKKFIEESDIKELQIKCQNALDEHKMKYR